MKKVLWIGFILIILFLSYILIKKMYVDNKFNDDYDRVKQVILQKDSENRGFSDVVKNKIDKVTSDKDARLQYYNLAKSKRDIVSSKTEEEYLSKSLDYFKHYSCLAFQFRKIGKKELNKVIDENLDDNQEMKDYHDYLSLFKYKNKEKIYNWLQDEKNSIITQSDYNRLCLK